jgi:hypothetical protein
MNEGVAVRRGKGKHNGVGYPLAPATAYYVYEKCDKLSISKALAQPVAHKFRVGRVLGHFKRCKRGYLPIAPNRDQFETGK